MKCKNCKFVFEGFCYANDEVERCSDDDRNKNNDCPYYKKKWWKSN